MNVIEYALHDPKTAVITAATTVMTGFGHAIDLIPNDIGKVATLIGIVLSMVLIYTHWRNGRAINIKLQLETELLRQELQQKADLIDRHNGG